MAADPDNMLALVTELLYCDIGTFKELCRDDKYKAVLTADIPVGDIRAEWYNDGSDYLNFHTLIEYERYPSKDNSANYHTNFFNVLFTSLLIRVQYHQQAHDELLEHYSDPNIDNNTQPKNHRACVCRDYEEKMLYLIEEENFFKEVDIRIIEQHIAAVVHAYLPRLLEKLLTLPQADKIDISIESIHMPFLSHEGHKVTKSYHWTFDIRSNEQAGHYIVNILNPHFENSKLIYVYFGFDEKSFYQARMHHLKILLTKWPGLLNFKPRTDTYSADDFKTLVAKRSQVQIAAPLHYAVATGDVALTQLFLNHGADLLASYGGQTVLDIIPEGKKDDFSFLQPEFIKAAKARAAQEEKALAHACGEEQQAPQEASTSVQGLIGGALTWFTSRPSPAKPFGQSGPSEVKESKKGLYG